MQPPATSRWRPVSVDAGRAGRGPRRGLTAQEQSSEAAQGIDGLFELNKDGAHFSSGLCLVDGMGGVDAYTVMEVAHTTELFLMLDEANSASLLRYGQELASRVAAAV